MKPRLIVRLLMAACVLLTINLGIRQSLGLFITPMTDELHWSRSVFALSFALQNLLWGAGQPIAGVFADRFGAMKTIIAGSIIYAASLVLMATWHDPLVYNFMGVLLGIGFAGCSLAIVLAAIAKSVPPEKRGVAVGIAMAGGSFGQLAVPPISQVLIGGLGWLPALLILAGSSALMVPLAIAFAGVPIKPPEDTSDQPVGAAIREALSNSSFWCLTFGFFVCGFHVAFIQTHLPAIVSGAGLPSIVGAWGLAIVGASNMLGTYVSGYLSGRMPKRYLLAAIYTIRGAIIAIFMVVPLSEASVFIFTAALGVVWLSTVPPTTGIVNQLFGLRWSSTLFGFPFFSHQIGAFFGAWLGGYIYDHTGSYQLMWQICVAVAIFAALINLPIVERPVARLAPQQA
jgi:MFS family permease